MEYYYKEESVTAGVGGSMVGLGVAERQTGDDNLYTSQHTIAGGAGSRRWVLSSSSIYELNAPRIEVYTACMLTRGQSRTEHRRAMSTSYNPVGATIQFAVHPR
jgi:hypothetical protein